MFVATKFVVQINFYYINHDDKIQIVGYLKTYTQSKQILKKDLMKQRSDGHKFFLYVFYEKINCCEITFLTFVFAFLLQDVYNSATPLSERDFLYVKFEELSNSFTNI